MLLQLKRLYYRLTRQTSWFYDPGETVWKRYNPETDRWETREMTEGEAEDSYAMWAIK